MSKFKQDATFWGMSGLLFLFWLLITWRLHWQHLFVGVLCSLAIARFNCDLLVRREERTGVTIAAVRAWLSYGFHLVLAVFKANWDVAKLVLNPQLNISPSFIKFNVKVKKPLNSVILANSITLTPGTLTVEIEKDVYIVHALTRASAESVASWEMMDRLIAIEEAEHVK
ncbi:MAG: Na+/H+ antiporter subunit E [Firmicutes bacterium]|nr:Na+/H+ antiporter subunit E [Bacillota bacterium]